MSSYYDGNQEREWPGSECDPAMSGYPDLMRALEFIEQLSTGWKHGTEGQLLLRINGIARKVVCGHAPVILHRTGGPSAGDKNSCGKCGRFIRTLVAPGTDIVTWVIDFEREEV